MKVSTEKLWVYDKKCLLFQNTLKKDEVLVLFFAQTKSKEKSRNSKSFQKVEKMQISKKNCCNLKPNRFKLSR